MLTAEEILGRFAVTFVIKEINIQRHHTATHEDPKEQSIRRAECVVGDESFQNRLQGRHETETGTQLV